MGRDEAGEANYKVGARDERGLQGLFVHQGFENERRILPRQRNGVKRGAGKEGRCGRWRNCKQGPWLRQAH